MKSNQIWSIMQIVSMRTLQSDKFQIKRQIEINCGCTKNRLESQL